MPHDDVAVGRIAGMCERAAELCNLDRVGEGRLSAWRMVIAVRNEPVEKRDFDLRQTRSEGGLAGEDATGTPSLFRRTGDCRLPNVL